MSEQPPDATKVVANFILFGNGMIAAFDIRGNQIPELQAKSAVELWADAARAAGYDLRGCECKSPQGLTFRLQG